LTKKKHRFLACAIALATGVSAAPQAACAEDADAVAAEAAMENPIDSDAQVRQEQSVGGGTEGGAVLSGIKESPATSAASLEPSSTMVLPSATGAPVKNIEVQDHESEITGEAPQASIAAERPQTSTQNERTAEWERSRPAEQVVLENMKTLEGQTIVEVLFLGAGETTEPTAKTAASLHAGDTFSVQAVEQDRDAIFRTGYFYDLYPSFEQVPEGVVLTYHLLENPILKDVVLVGNSAESTETLQKLVTVRKGVILNSVELHDNVTAIQEKYREDGYILAKIMDMNMDREGVLTLKINEGILEGYKVKGNQKTKDKVILREMRQKVGEPFNAKLARRSMQRVYNLGFFEDVNIKMNPGVEPNAVVMELDVKEKRTGTFGVGAGYSSRDGVIGMVSVSDTNFRGTGDAVSLTYERSGNEEDAHGYTFSYRHPWLDSKETSLTFRIYNRTYRFDDYDTNGDLKEEYMRKYSGGEITFSRPVSEYSTNYITLRHRKDAYVKHVSNGNMGDRSTAQWADWRNDNFGTTRSIIMEHVTDTRDNIYDPTTGGRVNLSVELAGLLGGDFKFQKYTIEDQRYFKVGRSHVFALRGLYGIGNGEISEFNQYRIGGQSTLRGYRDDQFRGNRAFTGTVEYRFPLMNKVHGALFADWGAVWDTGFVPKNFHSSVGAGFALTTPLGPIRLDYGYGSQGGRVHFSVGTVF